MWSILRRVCVCVCFVCARVCRCIHVCAYVFMCLHVYAGAPMMPVWMRRRLPRRNESAGEAAPGNGWEGGEAVPYGKHPSPCVCVCVWATRLPPPQRRTHSRTHLRQGNRHDGAAPVIAA
eukprot:GHVU01199191.1.p1 GENE.GHVU01199191.1~~GHVU01199191.1.p1  ORF type:complete len:120 (-),score=9.41 GHVU01199191.1:105-464(-)